MIRMDSYYIKDIDMGREIGAVVLLSLRGLLPTEPVALSFV